MAQEEDVRMVDAAEAPPCPDVVLTDRELLAAWVGRRDGTALQTLLDRHRPAAIRVCQRILRDPAEAEDAAQDACIALAGLEAMVDGEIAAWIRGSAAKAALQHRRARLRRRRREQQARPAVEGAPGDLLALVDECVELLPEQDRRLIGDYFYLERTQAEIAAAAGISQVAVHKRLRAALDRLHGLVRRRGGRLGALALLALLLGGRPAAQAAARDLGWGLARGAALPAAVAITAATAACLGAVLLWPRTPDAAPVSAPAPAAVAEPLLPQAPLAVAARPAPPAGTVPSAPAEPPGRTVLARPGPDGGTWRAIARATGPDSLGHGMVRGDVQFAEVAFGWRGRIRVVDGVLRQRPATIIELDADATQQLGIRAPARAPAGAPYAFRLEVWTRDGGVWRRAVHRCALVRRDGAAELFVSAQYFAEDGTLIASVPAPRDGSVAFPRSLPNCGTVFVVSAPTAISEPSLRLLGWDEVQALVREIDRTLDVTTLEPVAISDGEETWIGDPDPVVR